MWNVILYGMFIKCQAGNYKSPNIFTILDVNLYTKKFLVFKTVL